MVCDDEPIVRSAVRAVLERCGFVVGTAGSADAAVQAATAEPPDAIVVDLDLSGDRGVRLITALLQAAPGCAVVVVTTFTALRQAALDAGARVVIDRSDLRDLEPCLLDVARRAASRPDRPGAERQARST
ncbi:MAG: response regulator [Acidimicrobiales bacterium]